MLQRGKSVSNHVYRDNAGFAKISRAGHVLLSQQKHNLKLIFPVVRDGGGSHERLTWTALSRHAEAST